jgi:hypothetical protein
MYVCEEEMEEKGRKTGYFKFLYIFQLLSTDCTREMTVGILFTLLWFIEWVFYESYGSGEVRIGGDGWNFSLKPCG